MENFKGGGVLVGEDVVEGGECLVAGGLEDEDGWRVRMDGGWGMVEMMEWVIKWVE